MMRYWMIGLGLGALLLAGLPALSHAGDDGSLKVVKAFETELINGQDLSAFDRLLAADYRQHAPNGPNQPAEAFKGFAQAIWAGFPDVEASYQPLVVNDDMVTVYATVNATHTGEFFGIPATGKKVSWTEIHVFRISGDRIAEHWVEANLSGLVQQLTADGS